MTVQLKTETMIAGGDALAHTEDGRVIFVAGALPGELVDVEITTTKKDFQNGHVVSVIEPSSDRVSPPCIHFLEGCGGCQWQHASVDAQAQYKVDIVRDSLKRIARIEDTEIRPIRSVDDQGYRSTIRVAVNDSEQLCLHKKKSDEILPVPSCLVVDSLITGVLNKPYKGEAEEVQIRSSISEKSVSVLTELEALEQPKQTVQKETVAGYAWRVSGASFFQSGPQAAELLIQSIFDFTANHKFSEPIAILDAYGGVGLLGGSLMRARNVKGDSLVCVEENAIAVADASSNLADLNATVVSSEMSTFKWRGDAPDVVIADPARPGLGKKVAASLAGLRAQLFILINCDPASMARDVRLIADMGYDLKYIQPLDLFPHTSQIETVACFARMPRSSKVEA